MKCNFSVKFPLEYLVDAPRKVKKQQKKEKKNVPVQNAGKPKNTVIHLSDDEDEDEQQKPDEDVEKGEKNVEGEIANDFEITSNTSWEDIELYLGTIGRPFISNSPAGPTKIHGYPGLAVEVLSNEFLGAVYMFPPNP